MLCWLQDRLRQVATLRPTQPHAMRCCKTMPQVLHLFDDLLLLTDGRVIYQ